MVHSSICLLSRMRNFVVIIFGTLLVNVITGCSVQKRSLLPGYHIEWKNNSAHVTSQNIDKVQDLSIPFDINAICTAEASLSDEYVIAPSLQATHPKNITSLPPISPYAISHQWDGRQIVKPQPWEAAEKKQKRFGNIALGSLIAQVILTTLGVSPPLLGAITMTAFILNRVFKKEVLNIKSRNGIDVTEERNRFQKTNRRIAIIYGALMLIGLVMLVLLFAWIFSGGFVLFG